MGFFDMFKRPDFAEGLARYEREPQALLIDVRSSQEYAEGHVPGSRNIDVQRIQAIARAVPDKKTPLFVYCASGMRSSRAAGILEGLGYEDVTDLGGLNRYRGALEK